MLLTVEQVAAVLQLSPTTLYRKVESGQLDHVKIGRNVRIRAATLEELTGRPISNAELQELLAEARAKPKATPVRPAKAPARRGRGRAKAAAA